MQWGDKYSCLTVYCEGELVCDFVLIPLGFLLFWYCKRLNNHSFVTLSAVFAMLCTFRFPFAKPKAPSLLFFSAGRDAPLSISSLSCIYSSCLVSGVEWWGILVIFKIWMCLGCLQRFHLFCVSFVTNCLFSWHTWLSPACFLFTLLSI